MKTKENNTNKDRYKQYEKMDQGCRPNICTGEKYIQSQKVLPGNRTYTSATKYEWFQFKNEENLNLLYLKML